LDLRPQLPRASTSPGAAAQGTPDYAALIAAPDRSAADRATDARRDPLKLLAFIGARPGMKVLDLGAGGGYSTEFGGREMDVEHLDRCKLVEHSSRSEAGRQRLEPCTQRDVQAVGQEGDEDMRLDGDDVKRWGSVDGSERSSLSSFVLNARSACGCGRVIEVIWHPISSVSPACACRTVEMGSRITSITFSTWADLGRGREMGVRTPVANEILTLNSHGLETFDCPPASWAVGESIIRGDHLRELLTFLTNDQMIGFWRKLLDR
jgi:hypothetical protein